MTWQTKRINEVCEVGAGNSAPQKRELFKNGKYPFFRTSDVGKVKISKSLKETSDYLNKEGIKGLKFFKKGTILFPKSGASTFLNHRVIMGIDGYVVSHLATIKTNEKTLNNIFLFYLLQEIKAQDLIQDHKYPSLNLSVIKNIQIPLPPLPEQRRIVKILDEVFEKTAKAKENAKKNLANAKELFESYLGNVFANQGKNWEEKKFGKICDIYNGSTPLRSKKEYWKNGNVNWFTIKDIRLQGRKIKFTGQKITKKALKESSIKLLPVKTVLICCTASVGEWAISEIELTTNQQFNGMVIKDKSKLLPEFLFYFSSTLKDKLLFVSGKTTIDFVSMAKLKQIQIPFPPLTKQKSIVKKLDALSVETKKLESIYKQKLSDLEELKKSVLRKAFEGEL